MGYTKDEVIEFLVDVFERDFETMKTEDCFKDYDEWDSLVALSLVASMEDSFGVSLNGEQLESLNTIQDIINFINK